jgi:hypothetical protein
MIMMDILFKNIRKYQNTTAVAKITENNKIYMNFKKFMIMLQPNVKNLLKCSKQDKKIN